MRRFLLLMAAPLALVLHTAAGQESNQPVDPTPVRSVGKAVREHPGGEGTQIGVEFLILRDTARDRIRAYVASGNA